MVAATENKKVPDPVKKQDQDKAVDSSEVKKAPTLNDLNKTARKSLAGMKKDSEKK